MRSSNLPLDEVFEHLQRCIGFIRGNHVSSCVYDIISESVVPSDQCLEAASGVEHRFLLLGHLPSDSLDVLLSLDVRHLCVDVSSEEKDLQASFLKVLEEADSACVLFEG